MVSIWSHCGPADLSTLSMTETFTKYARYNPIISSIEGLIKAASRPEANVTIALNADRVIVGFAILQFPSVSDRWHRVGRRIMMEVAVIEVSRKWRAMGISSQLLSCLVKHSRAEDRILFMVGYSWTWDLDGIGLTPIAYRDMMIHLFAGQGFRTYQTNEPNIMMRPENLFMARVGAHISEQVQKKFKLVRFNMDER